MATRREAQTDDERSLCVAASLGNLRIVTELLDKGVFVDVFVCSTLREDFRMNRKKNTKQAKGEIILRFVDAIESL